MNKNGFINFPRQKLAQSKKNDQWFKDCINFAENLVSNSNEVRASLKNKQTNYNLRSNIINKHDFQKYINPSRIDMTTLPAEFQHIGIENTKLNLLVGEYIKRNKEYIATISASDGDSIGRKEAKKKLELQEAIQKMVMADSLSEQDVQMKMQKLQQYFDYEFQDIGELIANKILKREHKAQNFDFIFQHTFEDLLISSEQVVYVGVLGGEPVMRRVDPRTLETIGGNSMYLEDSDVIIQIEYRNVSQVIDDYWDVLTEKDAEYLETGTSATRGIALGLHRDMSVYERYGENALTLVTPNELGVRTFGGSFDSDGKIRVLKVVWRTRRKIGKRKYFDEFGVENYDFVPEFYKPKKEEGEEVKWLWVNEWVEGTKIGEDIFVNMRPIPTSGKSLTNMSKGTPPFIGSINSTNGTKAISLTDIMKPLSFSYDIAYYKRELAIATSKGTLTAINAALIPSGWDPEDWIHYATVNKFLFLDPTNEILKGPAQGKSAGVFNTITATKIDMDDTRQIQMYTDLLAQIEYTMSKLAGVSEAREGQIQTSEAVGNTQREITQSSHITEKWFAIDANFRKRALGKFLEVAKYAYKKNPKRAEQIFGEIGMSYLESYEPFAESEFDIHIGNDTKDTQLLDKLSELAHAAIQNGNATIADLVAIERSESIQDISKKLEQASEALQARQEKMQMEQTQMQEQTKQMAIQQQEAARLFEEKKHADEMALKQQELELKAQEIAIKSSIEDLRIRSKVDTNENGIEDSIDRERIEMQKEKNLQDKELKASQLRETERHNKEMEKISRDKKTSN